MFDTWETELCHHGIKGQKWGVRRYQNADGSLTDQGRKRLYKDLKFVKKQEDIDNRQLRNGTYDNPSLVKSIRRHMSANRRKALSDLTDKNSPKTSFAAYDKYQRVESKAYDKASKKATKGGEFDKDKWSKYARKGMDNYSKKFYGISAKKLMAEVERENRENETKSADIAKLLLGEYGNMRVGRQTAYEDLADRLFVSSNRR